MQKIIMLLFALLTTTMASAQSVYIATSKGAVAYHKSKDCGYLRNANEVKAVPMSNAKDMGRHACSACYDDNHASTKAVAKKKAAPAPKKAEPEVKETAKKKAVAKRASKEKEIEEPVGKAKKASTAAPKEKKTSAKATSKNVEGKVKAADKKAPADVKEKTKKTASKAKAAKEEAQEKKAPAKKSTKKNLDKAA